MPWYEGNIPSKWEDALERKTGAKIAVKVVFDPDGQAITMDGDHDITGISEITQERDLDIDAGGQAYIPDVSLTFNDLDNYFDPDNTASPFHQCEGELYEDAAASATTIKLVSHSGVVFAADEVLEISDATNSEEVIVASFTADNGSTGYHTLVIDAPGLVNAFAAGSRIYTRTVVGKKIIAKLVNLTETTPEELVLFQGDIVRAPETEAGVGRIICADSRKKMLDTTLVGADSSSSLKLMCVGQDGTLVNSIDWENEFNIPPLTYTISDGALPTGLLLDSESGVISGTPTTPGTYTFTIKVTNRDGESKTQSCSMIIYTTINTEFVEALGLGDFAEETVDGGWEDEITYDLTTISGSLTFTLASMLAGWFEWYPGILEYNAHMLRDNAPGSMTNFCAIFKLTVANMGENVGAHIGAIAYASNREDGYHFGYYNTKDKICFTEVSTGGLNHRDTTTSMPTTLIFRMYRLSGVIYYAYKANWEDAWTALGSRSTTKTLAYLAVGIFSDETAPSTATSGSFSFDYFRTYYGSLAVVTAALPKSRQGDEFDYTLRASGGAADYVWDVSVGSLPAGLSLDAATGRITGTMAATGTTNFTVRVTDGAGSTATQALSIVAADENEILPDIFTPGDDNAAYSYKTRIYVGGGLDRDQVTIGSRCPLGKWTFQWTSSTAFEATPPGMAKHTGDITAEFTIANVITIPAAAWSSGMATDDIMTFITGITWIDENPVQMIYDVFVQRVGLAPKQIDASSFFGDVAIGDVAEYTAGTGAIKIGVTLPAILKAGESLGIGAVTVAVATGNAAASSFPPQIEIIPDPAADYTGDAVIWNERAALDTDFSFDAEYEHCQAADILLSLTLERSMTIAQAIESICAHAALIQHHFQGLECLHCMRPRVQSATQDLTESEIKPDVKLESFELVNVITVKYAYDYFAQEYQGTYTYPPSSAANPSYRKYGKETEKTIYCPGIYDAEQAQLAAQRKYEQYANGLSLLTINLDLRAMLMRIGEQWDIDIDDPDVVGRFETIKRGLASMGARNVQLTGYNAGLFEKFAITDTAMADVSCTY